MTIEPTLGTPRGKTEPTQQKIFHWSFTCRLSFFPSYCHYLTWAVIFLLNFCVSTIYQTLWQIFAFWWQIIHSPDLGSLQSDGRVREVNRCSSSILAVMMWRDGMVAVNSNWWIGIVYLFVFSSIIFLDSFSAFLIVGPCLHSIWS